MSKRHLTCTMFRHDVSRLKLRICDIDVVAVHKLKHTELTHDHSTTLAGRESSDISILRSPAKVQVAPCSLDTSDVSSNSAPFGTGSDLETRQVEAPGARPETPSNSDSFRRLVFRGIDSKLEYSHIRVEASVMPLPRCDRFCVCQCHRATNLATPINTAHVLGRLFVGYTGLPLLSHSKCNRKACRPRRTQVSLRIAYLFPVWFALRLIALTITKASKTFMWKLNFPVVTQTSAPMFILTSLGNTEAIQALLGCNAAVLNAIDAVANKSPLHVRTVGNLSTFELTYSCSRLRCSFVGLRWLLF